WRSSRRRPGRAQPADRRPGSRRTRGAPARRRRHGELSRPWALLLPQEGKPTVYGTVGLRPVALDQEQVSDEQILTRIAAGDRGALAELHARYQRALFRYLCQLTPDRGLAEEILKDTLVEAWRGAASKEGGALF